jgi:outer membrane biosynthesis protein TonB
VFEYDDEEDRNFVQRHRGLVLIGVVLGLGGGVFYGAHMLMGSHQSAPHKDDMMVVSLPPPPPPPKPPPTPPPQQAPTPEQQQQQDQKMVEQQPVQNEKKSEAPKEKPDAPAPLGTSITGPGPGGDLGLGSGLGTGGDGTGGGGGTKYGWYASEVQTRIADALRNNPSTRTASMNVVIRIWPDASGRITKARLSGSTGDPTLDATLRNNILIGMQLSDPPPADMPLPIVMRVSAQRPQ